MEMKKLLLIATGGTIASKVSPEGLQPGITSEELLAYVPEVRENCMVDTVQPFELSGTLADFGTDNREILQQLRRICNLPWNGYYGVHGSSPFLSDTE